jgi:hypothetical protein
LKGAQKVLTRIDLWALGRRPARSILQLNP